ncbi:MAG: hypothetical protein K5770_15845 [Lachnospiraceae bacterium]|nr:hypothetical protein [Lachnospiraceae bacterium]
MNFMTKAYYRFRTALGKARIATAVDFILKSADRALEATGPAAKEGYFSDTEADRMLKEIDRRLRNLKLRLGQLRENLESGRRDTGYMLMRIADDELSECGRIYGELKKITDESDPLMKEPGYMFAKE